MAGRGACQGAVASVCVVQLETGMCTHMESTVAGLSIDHERGLSIDLDGGLDGSLNGQNLNLVNLDVQRRVG